jgi:mono/diheme cytochrome c family protein
MPVSAQWWSPLTALAMGLSACPGQKLAARTARRAPESPAKTFKLYCSGCHGAKGQGGAGANLQGLADSRAEIAAIITHGQGKMPAFGRRLTVGQIRRMAVYVKGFKQ